MKLTTLLLSLTLAASATLFSQEVDHSEKNYQFFSDKGSAQLSFSSDTLPIKPIVISVHKKDILNIICYSSASLVTGGSQEIQTYMRLKYDKALNTNQQHLLAYTSSIDWYGYNDESQTSADNTTICNSVNQTVTFQARGAGEEKIILSFRPVDCQNNTVEEGTPSYVTIIVTITP